MYKKPLILLLVFITSLLMLNACSVPKFAKPGKVDASTPVNAKERARNNVNEGRGVSLKGAFSNARKSTNYEFSTSNPLWRSSLEILDFLPLTTVDYSGGIIITDWYNDSSSNNESIKITVRFLSNNIQSNSVKVIVHSKKCSVNQNCRIIEIDSKIKEELQKSILQKASLLDSETKKKNK
jgi:hypothetical protein